MPVTRITRDALDILLRGEIKENATFVLKFYSNDCHLCHSLKDYYNNIRMNYQKKLEPLQDKLKREQDNRNKFQNMMDRMDDEEYYDTMEYLKGNKTKH